MIRTRNMGKYKSIQVLRGIAALMVLVFHTKTGFPHDVRDQLWFWPILSDQGTVGVYLFFVISGFILGNVLDRPQFSLGGYLRRRALRIVPLYWLVMLTALVLVFAHGAYIDDLHRMGASGMVKSFLIFPQKDYPFWPPGWSLEHEVIFYLIAAAVAPALGLRSLAGVLVFLYCVGIAANFDWDYHIFSYAQLFFATGVIAYLHKDAKLHFSGPICVVSLLVAYAQFYKLLPQIPASVGMIAFAIGFAALIVALLHIESSGLSMPRALVSLGDASYSLYLWHWLVIPALGFAWKKAGGGSPECWRWIMVTASIAVAVMSYRFIERPLLEYSKRHRGTTSEAGAITSP
jgi:exopolysaccharide production protein ExoZ